MLKRILTGFLTISTAVFLISWGATGHYKISYNASLSFFEQMAQFNPWITYLADHSSDADIRKDTDPSEQYKHYIDLDSYAAYYLTGHIPQTWDSVVAANGAIWVTETGTLPWATVATYDSLKHAFQQQNWGGAMYYAADLGHYVADGHMPLHITKNYDGQLTGNDGIHSRYETTMINAFDSQIVYTGDTVHVIADVNKYVFNYIYKNYGYIDSVLAADTYAKSLSTNTNSPTYKNALWSQTRNFTILLFKNASHAFAELIYNAWLEAGSPTVETAGIAKHDVAPLFVLEQNSPNPFKEKTLIRFSLKQSVEDVSLRIIDSRGNNAATLINGNKPAGTYSIEWTPNDLPSGIYFCELSTGKAVQVIKMIHISK